MSGRAARLTTLRWLTVWGIAVVVIALGSILRPPAARPKPAPHGGVEADDLAPAAPERTPAEAGAAASVAPTAAVQRPVSNIRRDYDSELRDAEASAVEERIRTIFAAQRGAQGALREVRCTRSVCRIEARWSRELHAGYNGALLGVVRELSTEVSFEPAGPLEGPIVPMTIFVRRPLEPSTATRGT